MTTHNKQFNTSKILSNDIFYVISNSGMVNLSFKGTNKSISTGHPNHFAILCALQDGLYDIIPDLIDVTSGITTVTNGRVVYQDGDFYFDNEKLQLALVNRMYSLANKGFSLDYLVQFLENVYQNPTISAQQELFLFLEASRLPITEDGCFLAYKMVREDFKDQWTGTIDNSVGAKPKMDREKCDPCRTNTCSTGFHFCSFKYLGQYNGGTRLIIVKVNPKNVTAIPSDYKNAKGRCCTYEVVRDMGICSQQNKEDAYEQFEGKKAVPLYNSKGGASNKSSHNNRDLRGRFIKITNNEPKRDSKGRFCKIT